MTRIYAGFPGVGKSHLFKDVASKGIKISDSDSSQFSWVIKDDGTKERNPEFPQNYIKHIQSLINQKYDVVLVSTHDVVINALKEAGVPFAVVRPVPKLKDVYLDRYRQRGSDEGFINLMNNKWEDFHKDLENAGVPTYYLNSENEFLSHVVLF